MTSTGGHFAERCLPLLMANQAGWVVLSSHTVRAVWTGSDALSGLRLECLEGRPPFPFLSHFGHGILTWQIPFLFRTPPGYNLLVRGPSNWPKDGATPLEGLVETDWAVSTFTMNWKLTRVDLSVTFEQNEPICMVVPQLRHLLENFQPEQTAISADPELTRDHAAWSHSRRHFLLDGILGRYRGQTPPWQKDYFIGTTPTGRIAPGHQQKLRLREFRIQDPGDEPVERNPHTPSSGREPGPSPTSDVHDGRLQSESS